MKTYTTRYSSPFEALKYLNFDLLVLPEATVEGIQGSFSTIVTTFR